MNFEEETGVGRETGVVLGSRLIPVILTIVAVLLYVASQATILEARLDGAEVAYADQASEQCNWSCHVNAFVSGFGSFIFEQVRTVWVLVLYALIPGVAGIIYRRAFWPWFLLPLAILFAFNSGMATDAESEDKLINDGFYLFIESQLIFLLLATSLRRHVAVASVRTVTRNVLLPIVIFLIGAALIWGAVSEKDSDPARVTPTAREEIKAVVEADARKLLGSGEKPAGDLHSDSRQETSSGKKLTKESMEKEIRELLASLAWLIIRIEAGLFLIAAAYILFRQRHEGESKPKNIVLCMDGTWNHPGQTDFGYLAQTNVFKLYSLLEGKATRRNYNASLSKTYEDEEGKTKQVGLYFHGVGNPVENNPIAQAVGGAMGMGAEAIIERAYLDVVRVYKPGDRIFIFGFSRGAAIARLIAGVIGCREVPKSMWTLSLFGRHWLVWKSSKRFENVRVNVLGCWDTVGAFGIAKNIMGIPFQKINLLKDLSVSDCVRRAYHMVALDETRDAFEPTLMDPDPTDPARIVEVWFPGNHSNVGGGYVTDGLSDLALGFLLKHVSSGYTPESDTTTQDEAWGLYLKKNHVHEIGPDAKGKLRYSTGPMYKHAPRAMPLPSVVHDSVFERMKEADCGYAPKSIFVLGDHLVEQQKFIEDEVGNLGKTRVFSDDDATQVVEASKQYLTLTKWSTWRGRLRDLKPEEELAH